MATRRRTTARRTLATAVDFRAIVGDEDVIRGVETDANFPGCCGITVLNEFPYDYYLGADSKPTKEEAQRHISDGDGKVLLATVDVQSQSKALAALLALGFTEVERFSGERAGHQIALLMKKNTRR